MRFPKNNHRRKNMRHLWSWVYLFLSWSSNLWKIKKITNYYFCKCISKLAKITQKEHLLATRNFGTSKWLAPFLRFGTSRKMQTFQNKKENANFSGELTCAIFGCRQQIIWGVFDICSDGIQNHVNYAKSCFASSVII